LNEIVDRERVSCRKPRARVPHQLQRPTDARLLLRERLLLYGENFLKRQRMPRKQLCNFRQRQTKAFQRKNLMQPRDLFRAIGAPARLRTDRSRRSGAPFRPD
jgi:hypothetical protein